MFAPIPLIRRNHIVRQLEKHGAVSKQTAVTLEEAGVVNLNAFSRVNNVLIKQGVLSRIEGKRYYLNK